MDSRNEKIGYMIREARQIDRVPYMLIIGGREAENKTVSVRDRATDQTESMTFQEFAERIQYEITKRL